MEKKLKILGIVSMIIGGVAALCCLSPKTLIIAFPTGFIGMVCSCIYVFIDTRDQINTKKITPGIIGVILSSVPVLIILVFTIIHYFKS